MSRPALPGGLPTCFAVVQGCTILLGNITLVYPLERLYNTTFQRNWEKTLGKIRLTSPGDLEEMDALTSKLERYYDIAGIRKMSSSVGMYPDEYASRIKSLRSGLNESISSKFRKLSLQVSDLIGDTKDVSDFESERKRFDEAIAIFRMMRAFFKRWKLDTKEYCNAGVNSNFGYDIKRLAHNLARKRMNMMKKHSALKTDVEVGQKIKLLDEISLEVSKLFDWYKCNYLNVDGSNPSWMLNSDNVHPWMSVGFLDEDLDVLPLERFRKVPTKGELLDIQKLFDRFVEFYRNHELVGLNEVGVLSDFVKFKAYAENFSIFSDDSEERLKAGLMEQMLRLHTVLHDANARVDLKEHTENMFGNSFAMYFAPIDEVYDILQKGYICSEHSIHHKVSGRHYDNLLFSLDADIKEGDIGFIFPMTKLIEGNDFYQVSYNPLVKEGLSESNTHLHVFGKKSGEPVRIDIRQGIFVAPKDKVVRYHVDGNLVKETCEQYFKRFFSVIANSDSESWFDGSRMQNWLSRHCVFYDRSTRVELLNLLRNKYFVSIINQFTNKKYDNLALAQIPGTLHPTERYVTHKFETMPEKDKELLGSDIFNIVLFKWDKTDV